MEKTFKGFTCNGFIVLVLDIILFAQLALAIIFMSESTPILICSIALVVLALISLGGYVMLEPNECRAMVFFGEYKGTFYKNGLWWVNPFIVAKQVSLRARNLNVDPIKVNDRNGNPILIGLVLVWKINNSYKALFEIDAEIIAKSSAAAASGIVLRMKAFEGFVRVQSDAALRQVAGQYAYDSLSSEDSQEFTLRGGGDEINKELEEKLNQRLAMAGIEIVEARINYLAYAPEIAAVMLRRQQAEAIISAREKIVEGAVSMVKLALERLNEDKVVQLDEEKKAAMVSNLLVVLCADESAQPVVNTGSIA